MKTLTLLLVLFALTGSCKKESVAFDNACTTANPVENVAWLKAMKTSLDAVCKFGCAGALLRGTYQGQTVYFSLATGGPACDVGFGTKLFDCQGQLVKVYTFKDQSAFLAEVTNQTALYTTPC